MAQLDAVDGEQEVALAHVDPRSQQRRAVGGVPVLAAKEPGDAVAPGGLVELELGAELAAFDSLDLRLFAGDHVGVTRLELSDHLAEDEVELAAVADTADPGAVALAQLPPVVAVHALVVEEVAVDPPAVVEHLPPFGTRIDLE